MDVGGLLARFAPPPGDAGQVRAAAEAWRRTATAIEQLADRSSTGAASLGSRWSGPARQAFDGHWHAFAAGLGEGGGRLREGAAALDRVADAIDEARARYLRVMGGAAVTVVVGVLLTPVTLGTSDGAAGAAVAGEVGALLATLADVLGVEAATLATVAGLGARMLAAFTVQTAVVAGADLAVGAVVEPDHDPLRHADLVRDVEAGLVGAVAVPMGALAAVGAAAVLPGALGAGRAGAAIADATAFGASDLLVHAALDGAVDPGEAVFAALGAGTGSLAVRAARGMGRSGSPPVPRPAALVDELPPHLREVLDASTPVPAGRSFFDPAADPWLARLVPKVPAEPGRAVVFVHGNALGVHAAGRALSAGELAELVRADPRLAGRPLTLFACEAGKLDDGLAARLARELGVEVTAPTELAWLSADGTMYTTKGWLLDDGWVQAVPPDGHWRRFPPPMAP